MYLVRVGVLSIHELTCLCDQELATSLLYFIINLRTKNVICNVRYPSFYCFIFRVPLWRVTLILNINHFLHISITCHLQEWVMSNSNGSSSNCIPSLHKDGEMVTSCVQNSLGAGVKYELKRKNEWASFNSSFDNLRVIVLGSDGIKKEHILSIKSSHCLHI